MFSRSAGPTSSRPSCGSSSCAACGARSRPAGRSGRRRRVRARSRSRAGDEDVRCCGARGARAYRSIAVAVGLRRTHHDPVRARDGRRLGRRRRALPARGDRAGDRGAARGVWRAARCTRAAAPRGRERVSSSRSFARKNGIVAAARLRSRARGLPVLALNEVRLCSGSRRPTVPPATFATGCRRSRRRSGPASVCGPSRGSSSTWPRRSVGR